MDDMPWKFFKAIGTCIFFEYMYLVINISILHEKVHFKWTHKYVPVTMKVGLYFES